MTGNNVRSVAFYDTVATLVHACVDEVVAVLPLDGLLERDECFLMLKALHGNRKGFKAVAVAPRECSRDSDGVRAQ